MYALNSLLGPILLLFHTFMTPTWQNSQLPEMTAAVAALAFARLQKFWHVCSKGKGAKAFVCVKNIWGVGYSYFTQCILRIGFEILQVKYL